MRMLLAEGEVDVFVGLIMLNCFNSSRVDISLRPEEFGF